MKPNDRKLWILDYLTKGQPSVDVLNTEFSLAYNQEAAPTVGTKAKPLGLKNPQLGKDLASMHSAGQLDRVAKGVEGKVGLGRPKWIYSYTLPQGT